MKNYIVHHPWNIVEDSFRPEYNRISESIFSIGNGQMGQRANFEEDYSGDSLSGSYVAGVYYPDKTRVGWWKNGYPEYFAKVLNAANWIGIRVEFDGENLDLAQCDIQEFERVLNMKEGYLERTCLATTKGGIQFKLHAIRFCSIADNEIGAIKYSITPYNFSGNIRITPYIDANVENEDSNYDEKFWVEIAKKVKRRRGYVIAETKKTQFHVCTGMKFSIWKNGKEVEFNSDRIKKDKYIACAADVHCEDGETITVYKYGANLSSMNYEKEDLAVNCEKAINRAYQKGFDVLLKEQAAAWADKWKEADIVIEGDVSAQQGIRFNIFQLYQTYTGEDARLNIGPKGFTGEKYGGSTYWDTEAYCLPFYLATADSDVARNLVIYRYNHLEKAIENAGKLGFTDGAALYPMVTMNGEECHNEWEITFEEIHRNGAIAYAIYDYIRYTGDKGYLAEYGLEVLVGIARFWAQRVHFSKPKQQYVMHGVTGPNEYENNVNNNWYTNYIAAWCLQYAIEAIDYVQQTAPKRYERIEEKIKLYKTTETNKWKEIAENIYLPEDEALGVFLQQEGFLDKDIKPVDELRPQDRPLNQNWSWDRILRSCYIKQADTLQGLYFFEDQFDEDVIRRNFDFYEPLTVHESSLSPCVHVVLAAKLGKQAKAYEMYVRTARLDLDDYNNDTEDGCHITSMAGTWLAVVKGLGGMRVYNDMVEFHPFLPEQWESMSFKVRFRGHFLKVKISKDGTSIRNQHEEAIELKVYDKKYVIGGNEVLEVA